MNEAAVTRAPGWFRIVAVVALLWNLIGVYFYLVHVGAAPGPPASEAEAAIGNAMPAWATAAFAIGVFAGVLGGLGLITRKLWARPVLVLSLIALILEQGWILFASGALDTVGGSAAALPIMVLVGAVLLVWLANHAARKGWLR